MQIFDEPRPSAAEEMAAFDALPPDIRRMLASGPYTMRATDVLRQIRFSNSARVLRMIGQTYAATISANRMKWRSAGYPGDLPHMAADATLMVTEPIEPDAPRPSPRRHRRRR